MADRVASDDKRKATGELRTAVPTPRAARLATLVAVSVLLVAACGESTSEEEFRTGPSFRARVALLNKTHELHEVRIQHLAEDVRLDCDRVAEAPHRYLRPEVFGAIRRRTLYSGQQVALGVEVPGTSPPALRDSECRAALVSVGVAPEIIVFWDGSLRAKSFVRNPRGSKSELGGDQTVELTGDYSRADRGEVRDFRYRPCREDGVCGTQGQDVAASIPDGTEYNWAKSDGPRRYWPLPDDGFSPDDPPKQCRDLLESSPLDWGEPPEGERTIARIDRGENGCHTIEWREEGIDPGDAATYRICAPWSAISKLRPTASDGRVAVDLESTTDFNDPNIPHEGVEIRVSEETAGGVTIREGQMFLTRGTGGLPTLATAEFRPLVPEKCGPRVQRCGQTHVPAVAELSAEGSTWKLPPGERVRIDAERTIFPARTVYRAVARSAEACGSSQPIDRVLDKRPGLFVEAVTVVGLGS